MGSNLMLLSTVETNPNKETTLLFLHGGGLNYFQWQSQIADLSEFHCIAPDLPEHGGSAAIGPLTLNLCTTSVFNILNELAPGKPVHLVGHSFGATVALGLLKQQPNLFESAILSGGSAGLSSFLVYVSDLSANLMRFAPAKKLVEMTFDQFRIPVSQRPFFERDLLRSVQPDFMRQFTVAMRELVLPQDSQTPVLALVGEHETFVARQAAKRIAKHLAQAQAYEVPQVHHAWNFERPELFSRVVRDWVTHFRVCPPLRPIH